jgi:hypothetical protein
MVLIDRGGNVLMVRIALAVSSAVCGFSMSPVTSGHNGKTKIGVPVA